MSTTYYVSSSGNDSNRGTSISSPWKSISKVNSTSYSAGDQILFQGGQTFSGAIKFNGNAGSSTSAVTVSSFGSGKATINSGSSSGLYDYNASGVAVSNLNFVGSPGSLTQDGVKLEAASGGKSNVSVTNCNISGYRWAGILVQGDKGNGFNGVTLSGNTVNNNVDNGILFDSSSNSIGSHKNVTIQYNNVYGNYGSNDTAVTGSGLNLGSIGNGTVQFNTATNNGARGHGAAGIWTSYTTNLLVQHNIAANNHTTNSADGDGFDFDLDTSNSVMQYNYSYNNDGAGYMLDQWQNNGKMNGNVIRFNIGQNDGLKNSYGEFSSFGSTANSMVYNNSFYVAGGGGAAGIRVRYSSLGGTYAKSLHFANNAIVTTSNRPFISIPNNELTGNITFAADAYYAASGSSSFTYGGTYSSLSSFASSTGQEKIGGTIIGLQANPLFVSAGKAPALTDATKLSTVTAYNLTTSSPLIHKGINVSSLYGSVGITAATASVSNIGFYQGGATSGGNSSGGTSTSGTGTTSSGSGSTGSSGSTTSTTAVPSGWTSSDIGSVGKAGSSKYSSGNYTITAGGTDIQGTSDGFHYDYTTLSGNGTIVAKVASLSYANAWSKAGVMMRDGTASNARQASLTLSPNGKADFSKRTTVGGTTSNTDVSGKAPEWVKLIRSGNLFTAYLSTDGKNWKVVGSQTVAMNTSIKVGLAVSSHNTGATTTASFSNVTLTKG